MELKAELSLKDKLLSTKRWMVAVGAALPVLTEALTSELSWPVAITLSVVALIAGVLGLAKEDAARLTAAAQVLATQISYKEETAPDEEDDGDEWVDDDEDPADEEDWADE